MTRTLQRRQRPASLQLPSAYGSSDSEAGTSSRQTQTRGQSPGRAASTVTGAPTRTGSPTRSTTTPGTSRTSSAPKTVLITITTTRRFKEDEDDTPSPTKTVFFPTAPHTVLITVSDTPTPTFALSTTTPAAGSAQTQLSSNHRAGPALPQTARIGLAVLGAISGAALLLVIGIVAWKSWRRKASMLQDKAKDEVGEPRNPFLDPPREA